MRDQLYVGLMSGTSLDGIDAALVDLSNDKPKLLATHLGIIPVALKQQLLELTLPGENEIDRMGVADNLFAKQQVLAVEALLAKANCISSNIIAIGSHGQTIRHRPDFTTPFTLQIGNPALMAELLNCTVVADFRRRDVAAGGQGAPLVPAFHEWLFHHPNEQRFVVNIGGIANVTVLDPDKAKPVIGYDTGPGNVLMDYWIHQHRSLSCDIDGNWARSGNVIPNLLSRLMSTPYLNLNYPKSTGRELFNGSWLEAQLELLDHHPYPADVQATLLEFTAVTICQAIENHAGNDKHLFLCGGGAENTMLRERISHLLPNASVSKTDSLGVPATWLEACAFAWLAKQCLEGQPGNLPAVTGAKERRILGAIYQA